MPLPRIPLAGHPSFAAETVGELESAVNTRLGARCVELPTERPITAVANSYRLPQGELWFCSYGQPVKIHFNETQYVRVQFHRSGTGSTRVGSRRVAVMPHQGCISRESATLAFGAGYEQLVWRVDRAALGFKLEAITGSTLPRALNFDPILDLSLPAARPLLGVLHDLVHCVSRVPEHSRFVESELEQALMVSLLAHSSHSGGNLLRQAASDAAPLHVKRVEEYIVAHLDEPFAIETAVAVTGCSARSVYRAFRQHRGYSPSEFSKMRRLQKAREHLRNGPPFPSVTDVAVACGFSNLSQFSRDYRRLFGEVASAGKRR